MCKILISLALLTVVNAQTLCRVATSPALMGLCPASMTLITSGDCCPSDQCYTATACADKTKANGQSDCPGMKSYCNNSAYKTLMQEQCPLTCGYCTPGGSTCADLTNPNTGKSDCAANASLCNNSLYKDMMKTQCPKTCGYCK